MLGRNPGFGTVEGLLLVLLGVVLALPYRFAATRVLASQLFGVTPKDPMTFVSVPALLLFSGPVGMLRSGKPRNARGSSGRAQSRVACI